MFKFSKCNAMSLFFLSSLSVSVFANAGFDEQTGLSEKSTTNLVELFKVKADASEYITNLEDKISATEPDEQEMILVEFAQALLYYQERHHVENDSKGVNAKGLNSKKLMLNKALNAYKKASVLALGKNRIKYTRQLSELTVSLGKKAELVRIFDNLLQYSGHEQGTYLTHVDYADGLAKFKDHSADTQFLSAINMRTPVDGVEANFRYANYLLDSNKLRDALSVLDKFTFEDRNIYVHIAMLRQKIMHQLKMDTQEVDAEIAQIRQNLSNNPLIGSVGKLTSQVNNIPLNPYGLPIAYANSFAHFNEKDDSRRRKGKMYVYGSDHSIYNRAIVNVSEVIYNEARGEERFVRDTIAWSIRNRATIDMNNCDSYPGAEGHENVNYCRTNIADNNYDPSTDLLKRYSCVVHGGTTKVGALHYQMDDTHVSLLNLELSGVLWEAAHVIRGLTPEKTRSHKFLTIKHPSSDFFTGNPYGAQEWTRGNYCPDNHFCKARLGSNFGGIFSVPQNLCPTGYSTSKDIYFWGRKPKEQSVVSEIGIVVKPPTFEFLPN